MTILRGLSIDIGVHNMAFYIEEFDDSQLTNIKCTNKRFEITGLPTSEFQDVLNKVYKNGNKILLEKVDLLDKKGSKFDLMIFINLSDY